jgi:tryptophanyl-tRNA synthetase
VSDSINLPDGEISPATGKPSASEKRPRVLSGMRPTGRLHIGHYFGALQNWVKMQETHDCFYCVVDWHALTTHYEDTGSIAQNVLEVATDWLAVGLDPERATLFLQSSVLEHAELHLLLSMVTPLSWLERVPTYKDQQEQLKEKDLATFGFLGYPLLQSADILVYQAEFVPVGIDQAAHVEITREIARRFNHLYGSKHKAAAKSDKERLAELEQETDVKQVLPEPKVLLTPSPKLPGTDGRKMSKSYGNTILMSEPEADVRAKLKTMVTDPARVRRTDPGNPEVCPVFDLHKVFSGEETQQNVRAGCTSAGIGCIQCKGWLADAVITELAPIQERRRFFEANPDEVDAILDDGAFRANGRTAVTMRQVFQAVGMSRR